jgi:TolB-like protein
MGAVYRARDPELDRPVAIKLMLDATPDFVARFRREAQAIARLTHANIVQVFDFGVDEQGNPYFVMELVEGRPLDAILRERGALPPIEAIRIVRQAAEGLAAAHRAGIVHRDVKPSNLILDGRGSVKLVDFGIARVATPSGNLALTGTAALLGTPGYMAPEQAQGKPVDPRVDIYALGLTLYEVLAGEPPYHADDPMSLVLKNLQEPLPDLRRRNPQLPEELVHLVETMSEKAPERRLQSCEAVLRALDEIVERIETDRLGVGHAGTAMAITDPASSPKVPSSAGPRARWLVTAVPIGLVALAGAWLLVNKRPPSRGPAVAIATGSPTRSGVGARSGPLRVAVLRFRNVGNDPTLVALEQGIGESALTLLAGASKDMSLVERADIDSEVKEIDRAGDFHFDRLTVAQAGRLQGIEYAVQGGFQKAGSQLRISARLVRVETGEIVDSASVTGAAAEVFEAQDAIATALRERLLALVAREKR